MATMRLRGKLIVSKADANCPTSKVKAVHLLKCITGLVGITEPIRVRSEVQIIIGHRGLTAQNHNLCSCWFHLFAVEQIQVRQTAQRHSGGHSQ